MAVSTVLPPGVAAWGVSVGGGAAGTGSTRTVAVADPLRGRERVAVDRSPAGKAKRPGDRAWRCQWVGAAGGTCQKPAAAGSHLCAEHAPKGSSWLSPAWEAVKRACQRASGRQGDLPAD